MKKTIPSKEIDLIGSKEGLLDEYRALKSEIHNTQGHRLQIISLTIGAFGVIISISAGSVLGSQNATTDMRLLIAIGSSIALYSILISSLIMIISVQQSIQRVGEYIRIFIEPEIAGLNWESRWYKYKAQHKYRGGLRGMGSIYFFLSFLPMLLPGYALSQSIKNWSLVLILIPFLIWSFYLTYDLNTSFSSGWKWARWENYDEADKQSKKKIVLP